MSSELRDLMERIRKNHRQYLREHINDFNALEDLNFEELLVLLYSSIGFGNDAKLYFDKAYNAIMKLEEEPVSDIAKVYYCNTLGIDERICGNYELATHYFFEGYAIAMQNDAIDLAARSLLGVASSLVMKGSYEEAQNVSLQALSMSVSIDDIATLGDIFNVYGSTVKYMGNITGAIDAYCTALMHYRKLPNYQEYLNYGSIIMNLLNTYIENDRIDEAEVYKNELLSLTKDNDDFFMVAQGSILLLADYYERIGDFENAYYLFRRLLKCQTLDNLLFQKRNKISDAQFTSQIVVSETLRHQNQMLSTKNAMLLDQLTNTSPKSAEIFRAVTEGIEKKEFVPFFQEIQSAATSQVLGYEVLVRWIKSDGSVVSPTDFIEVIEDTPLIIELSEQLIKDSLNKFSLVCRSEHYHQQYISFNIAPYQFVNQNLTRFLEATCAEYSVQPSSVVIEIIERTFIEHNSVAFNQIHELKKAGFRIALDDFGTGYSSLKSIAELPLDIVKIDKSLIENVGVSDKAYQLLQGIVFTINSLELTCIAEGIETRAQLEIMKRIGCDYVQGYYFHRPSATIQ